MGALTLLSGLVVGTLTLVDVVPLICRRRRPSQDLRLHIGILLCNFIYLVGLLGAVISPILVYSRRPFAAGVFSFPLLPLSLLVNESKWIVHGLSQRRSNVPAIKERGGHKVILW